MQKSAGVSSGGTGAHCLAKVPSRSAFCNLPDYQSLCPFRLFRRRQDLMAVFVR